MRSILRRRPLAHTLPKACNSCPSEVAKRLRLGLVRPMAIGPMQTGQACSRSPPTRRQSSGCRSPDRDQRPDRSVRRRSHQAVRSSTRPKRSTRRRPPGRKRASCCEPSDWRPRQAIAAVAAAHDAGGGGPCGGGATLRTMTGFPIGRRGCRPHGNSCSDPLIGGKGSQRNFLENFLNVDQTVVINLDRDTERWAAFGRRWSFGGQTPKPGYGLPRGCMMTFRPAAMGRRWEPGGRGRGGPMPLRDWSERLIGWWPLTVR